MREETLKALDNTVAAMQIVSKAIENDTHEVIGSDDTDSLVRHYARFRAINELIKVAYKALESIEDKLSKSTIPDTFRRKRIKFLALEDVGRVTIGHRWSCSIKEKPIGHQWLRNRGDGGLIIETVNSSTLAAYAKDLMETKGTELPQDIFTTSINPYTSITKLD